MKPTMEDYIRRLELQPHPEGGYYREVYRSGETIPHEALSARFGGARAFATHIHYLLPAEAFSSLHRIASDELWHHYAGDPLTVFMLNQEGEASFLRIGPEQHFGYVPAGYWFGSKIEKPEIGFSLVGCTVAPGFDFADFEMAEREEMIKQYPEQEEWIRALTRE